MQSLFQFRRAGLAVQAQIDRDLEKAQLITSDRSAGGNNAGAVAAATVVDTRGHAPNSVAAPVAGEKASLDPARPVASSRSSSAESSGNVEVEIGGPAERVETARTRYTEHTALGLVLTGVDVRDRASHEGGDGRIFVVGWEGPKDPHNPRNWSYLRRVLVTLQISLIGIVVTASSGIEATVLPQAAADLGVSEVAESLATGALLTLFVALVLRDGPIVPLPCFTTQTSFSPDITTQKD